MLIVTEATIANRGVLQTRSLPRKFLGRALVVPRRASPGIWLRLLVEMQVLRYLVTLSPFAVMPLMSRDFLLPVMEAPALMLVVVGLVELKLLRRPKGARGRALDEDEAARRLDMLAFRARACLRRIAARQGLHEGQLHLVVEQSELDRIPPLTLVSVQAETPEPRLLSLDAEDQAVLREGLFDAAFGERDLLTVNYRENRYIRDIAQEARAVSAHARLSAFLEKRAAAS